MSTPDIIQKYLKFERVAAHRQYIENLIKENDVDKLKSLLDKRLKFGTAGIRGSMGPGFSQMNDLVIIQISQGMASYLIELNEKVVKEQGVIIGHDARHNSDRFARLAALAFLQKGIPVYYCDHIIPTPLVAFGVRHFGCCSGIVITASHNPKNDNGFKVFGANGAQIRSPDDIGIEQHILRESNQEPWPRAWQEDLLRWDNTSVALPKEWDEIFKRVQSDLNKSYFTYIEALVGDRRSFNKASNVSITYTTMHGVGHVFLSRALDIAGFEDVFPVESQKKPDPNFSTVKFPNPEEAGALDLAFETAKHANSNLILANDPDSDRCAAALYDPRNNYKRVLSGNEIGALLGWWIWHCHKLAIASVSSSRKRDLGFTDSQGGGKDDVNDNEEEEEEEDNDSASVAAELTALRAKKPEDCYMITTAVSSKFLKSMAQKEGFNFIETLTGFKNMGNISDELTSKHNKCVLFAYEEAIGYMVDSTVLDKDGISAAIQLAQCAAYLSTTFGRTLEQQLDYLYWKYGYHYSINSYFTCPDPAIKEEIFKQLQLRYPEEFISDDGKQIFRVKRIRDLNNGFDSGTSNRKPTLPCSSSSFMVTFFIDDDTTITLRTSGTEPKIKYYCETVARLPAPLDESKAIELNDFNDQRIREAKAKIKSRLAKLVNSVIQECLKPEHYNLEPAVSASEAHT